MVVTRPPMGWNSWNTFEKNISEKMIMEIADRMVSEGLLDCGYDYLVIDDCWALPERDKNGRLVADPEKFPSGMKELADYVHSKGLKFGMYSCAGSLTCASFPGSYEHEFEDAETFASWGVDLLKYDYCFHDMNVPGEVLYRRMGIALANCGRDILYSACSWGADETRRWIKTTGAHMWRSGPDIMDNFESMKRIALKQFEHMSFNGKGCFNDLDMLTVGIGGKSHIGNKENIMNDMDYRTHFSLWAMFGSPLFIGCDIRAMSEETKKTLTNKDVIAIATDNGYSQPFFARKKMDEVFYMVKFLSNGDMAIGYFNLSDRETGAMDTYLNLSEVGLPRISGKTLCLKELWTGEEFKAVNECLTLEKIEPHGCRIYRATVAAVD